MTKKSIEVWISVLARHKDSFALHWTSLPLALLTQKTSLLSQRGFNSILLITFIA